VSLFLFDSDLYSLFFLFGSVIFFKLLKNKLCSCVFGLCGPLFVFQMNTLVLLIYITYYHVSMHAIVVSAILTLFHMML